MLVIKDVADLKKYLETRLKMVERQIANNGKDQNAKGQYYAFDESIKAVDALLTFQSEIIPETLERR